ncbi:hypothetical protein NKG05_13715 [Oerskovia sp. M15]
MNGDGILSSPHAARVTLWLALPSSCLSSPSQKKEHLVPAATRSRHRLRALSLSVSALIGLAAVAVGAAPPRPPGASAACAAASRRARTPHSP